MAQHDYVIDNQSFPATRSDLNSLFQAIASSNSGATAPSTTYANQIWYDTSVNKLYIRNEDNDAWIELFVLDQTGDHLEKIGDTITLDGTGNMSLAGDLTVDTNTLYVDSTNNRVGVGTASPSYAFELSGTTNPILAVTDTTTPVTNILRALDSSGYVGTQTSHPLIVITGGSERIRVRDDGGVGIGTSGASTVRLYNSEGSNRYVCYNQATNSAYTNDVIVSQCNRAASTAFHLLTMFSSGDREFSFRGDGNAFADGSFSGGGSDYAEMFEWDDGNSSNEDRRGYSVVLTNGNKIRKATSDDAAADIIGVVSAIPTILGDSAWNMWDGKYNKDDFGAYVMETYTVTEWTEPAVTNDDGEVTQEAVEHSYETDKIPSDLTVPSDAVVSSVDADGNTLERRQLNPSYDDTQTYTPREERQEWDAVGMMGKLRMRVGQPTGDRWIKMRDITSDIEEWLVR